MSGGWASWHGDAIIETVFSAAMKGLEKTAERVISDAVPNTPHLWGALRGNTDVVAVESEEAVYAVMGIGDSAPYAVYQHETLGLNHHGDGGPKFLENALNGTGAKYKDHDVQAAVKAVTR